MNEAPCLQITKTVTQREFAQDRQSGIRAFKRSLPRQDVKNIKTTLLM